MKDFNSETGNGGGQNWRPLSIVLVILVIATQTLVFLNIRNYYYANYYNNGGGGNSVDGKLQQETKQTTEQRKNSQTISKTKLKPLRVDMARFEIEVLKPHKDMKAKFPNHPDMIISKLFKIINKEQNRTKSILKKVKDLKHVIGISDDELTAAAAEEVTPTIKTSGFQARKLKSIFGQETEDLPLCPEKSPRLLGPLYVQQKSVPDLMPGNAKFRAQFGETIVPGGASKPENCLSRTKLAVILPYRDRAEHLKIFLHHMHPIFQRQLLDYRIFVVEQTHKEAFNRGSLMNIGYIEALKLDNFDCFAFHDVDLVPEDDRNIYECPSLGPKHMSVAVNKWKYRLQYLNYFGGVTSLSRDQFKQINGFANIFYGWGGEDDDLDHRIQKANFTLNRSPANIARFFMLKHDKVSMNDDLGNLMEKSKNNKLDNDGLSTLKYTKLEGKNFPLYTWILVDLPKAPPKKTKSLWSKLQSGVKDGMNYAAGGLAKTVAERAIKFAEKRDDEEEEAKDHFY